MIGALLERNPRFANWLYGFTPPEQGTVVLVHRRVYIVPTQLGWLYALTLLILLIGSINYSLSLGFALTFLLAGMGFAGMVHTARNLARMAVSVGRADGARRSAARHGGGGARRAGAGARLAAARARDARDALSARRVSRLELR